MTLCLNWISMKGSNRGKNSDFCGIALKLNTSFFMVADGSTKGIHSDQLAKELTCSMVDRFMSASSALTENCIISFLKEEHDILRKKFSAASASYVVLLFAKNIYKVIHSGDCRLGSCLNQGIRWRTTIHSVINNLNTNEIDLAQNPHRHILTKNFRPRRFIEPEVTEINVKDSQPILLTTDGFWAELPGNLQYQAVNKGLNSSISTLDDLSCLIIRKANSFKILSQGDNLYYCYEKNMDVII